MCEQTKSNDMRDQRKDDKTSTRNYSEEKRQEEDVKEVRRLLEQCKPSLLSQVYNTDSGSELCYCLSVCVESLCVSVWMSVDSRGSAHRPSMRCHHHRWIGTSTSRFEMDAGDEGEFNDWWCYNYNVRWRSREHGSSQSILPIRCLERRKLCFPRSGNALSTSRITENDPRQHKTNVLPCPGAPESSCEVPT